MFEFAKAECFHQWRDVDAEAAAQTLLQAVPAANGIARGAVPVFDRAFLVGEVPCRR